jgi:hypothetical protein
LEDVDKRPASGLPKLQRINSGKVDPTAREQGNRTIVIFVIGVRMQPFMELGRNGQG